MRGGFLILIALLSLLFSCRQQVNDEWIVSNPDLKVSIVFYFKKGTTNDEINYFHDNVVGRQRDDGRGTDFLDGMQVKFQVRNQDYEGYAIDLRKNVTQEERENILQAINSSPLIYKVFENVVPNEIVLDHKKAKQEKEELERTKQDNRLTKAIVVTDSDKNK
ncbi:MAG TPA: hypothetical protein VF599_12790 [Pyrinomonadaceae bacterium]|jgi:hypothetical protein